MLDKKDCTNKSFRCLHIYTKSNQNWFSNKNKDRNAYTMYMTGG